MADGTGRILFAWVLALMMLFSTGLVLGLPGRSSSSPGSSGTRGWGYPYFGGGHGGWVGRGFGWGSFGEWDDGFRGGGPGSGK
jgi:hypothetical protein